MQLLVPAPMTRTLRSRRSVILDPSLMSSSTRGGSNCRRPAQPPYGGNEMCFTDSRQVGPGGHLCPAASASDDPGFLRRNVPHLLPRPGDARRPAGLHVRRARVRPGDGSGATCAVPHRPAAVLPVLLSLIHISE